MIPARADSVSRTFGSFTAVDQVDIEVGAGEVVGVLGANGAGKTTLIRMILGLLRPTRGSVRLFGEVPSIEQRRRIGYVPQNLGLYVDLTIAENLSFRSDVFGEPADHDAVGGSPTDGSWTGRDSIGGNQLVRNLPQGVRRRVAFTAALQHRPALVVLDEPTSGVSPLARSELWDLIRAEADRGAGVLVSTHYMDEAVQADRLVVMAGGRVVARGTAADVIGDRQTAVVVTERWPDAFAAIAETGRHVMLAGRTIRIPIGSGEDLAPIAELLERASVVAELGVERATLEEAMVELSA